jgi:hypothetical protein
MQSDATKTTEERPADYGLDYETAKRILDRYGDGSLRPEELAVWLREAREAGYAGR